MKLNFLYEKTPNMAFFDLYSCTGNLKIQGKNSYSYLLSAILSILSIIIILILSIYFIIIAFERKSLSVILHFDSMNYPVVNLTDYPMTFHIYDSYGKSLNDQNEVYYFMGKYLEYKVVFDEDNKPRVINTITDLKFERCNISKHFGKYQEYFSNLPDLNLKYCLPPNTYNLTVYGNYGDISNGFSTIAINVHRCVNGNDGKEGCKSPDEVDNILNFIHLEYVRLDYDINHNIPENPTTLTRKADTFQISSTIFRTINKYMSSVEYSTDYGYVFENKNTLKFFQDDRHEVEPDFRKEGITRGSFASFLLLNSSKTLKYSRNFIKLQNLLANIGGIIQGVTVSVKVFNFIISHKLLNFVLFQGLFEILDVPKRQSTKKKFQEIIFRETNFDANTRNESIKCLFENHDEADQIKKLNMRIKNIK